MGSTTNDAAAGQPSGATLDRLILAPAVGLAALVVILCATVTLRVPLSQVVAPVGGLLALSLVGAVWLWQRSHAARPLLGIVLLAGLAGWLALVDYAAKWASCGVGAAGLSAPRALLTDVSAACLVFGLLCLGVQFLSVTAFCRVCVGYAEWLTLRIAASLATAGGWPSRVLMSANDDNPIFVSLAPEFIALFGRQRAIAENRCWGLRSGGTSLADAVP